MYPCTKQSVFSLETTSMQLPHAAIKQGTVATTRLQELLLLCVCVLCISPECDVISDTCSRVNHVKRANLHIHIRILHTKQSKHVRKLYKWAHTSAANTHTHTFFHCLCVSSRHVQSPHCVCECAYIETTDMVIQTQVVSDTHFLHASKNMA